MPALTDYLAAPASAVEGFFDRLKLGYKWRFDRWEHLQVAPYKGYGTRQEVYLKGRVLDDKNVPPPRPDQSVWRNVVHTVRRIETDEIPDARVRLHFKGQTQEATTDEDGFFTFRVEPDEPLPADRTWHEAELELLRPAPRTSDEGHATAQIVVPPPDAEFGIISDLDDTVVRTGATNKLQMARIVALNNAHTRLPFPGVAAFYRALQKGPDDKGFNPVFYVSSSPYNLYELFQHFFEAHNIPAGPIFLKDYGVTREYFFSTSHEQHKLDRIRTLLETYPDLEFVLIGDSGQHDPEIYHKAAQEYPDRIRAVFIRDVTTPARDAEVRALAEEVREAGPQMALVDNSVEAAEQAAEWGLIREEHVEEVREDKAHQEQEKNEPGGFSEKLLEKTPGPNGWKTAGLGAAALAALAAGATYLRRRT